MMYVFIFVVFNLFIVSIFSTVISNMYMGPVCRGSELFVWPRVHTDHYIWLCGLRSVAACLFLFP